MDIFDSILHCLDHGSSGVLATVVKRTGSAPRDVGAKMFVTADGEIFGTVGGGQLEADAFVKAREIMGKDTTGIFSVNMNAASVDDRDMLCGGNVDLLLEPVTERHRDVYEAITGHRDSRESAVVCTRFGHGAFAKSVISGNKTLVGDPLDQRVLEWCIDVLRRGEPELSGNIFAEPIRIIVPLFIFGAGHVSQHLAKMAKTAGFFVTVIDDRNEFANAERFQAADDIVVAEFGDAADTIRFTGNEYVVIVTRSHEHDAAVLEAVLKKNAKYIGMIGSRRKVGVILNRLHEKGFDRKITAGVYAPIGLEINAETPPEIAVSIVAQLIQVKNAK